MEILNPIAANLAQSVAVSRQQSTDKTNQIRRAQTLRKNVAAAPGDSFEHQVESAEELSPVHDEQKREQPPREKKPVRRPPAKNPSDDAPRIDVKA